MQNLIETRSNLAITRLARTLIIVLLIGAALGLSACTAGLYDKEDAIHVRRGNTLSPELARDNNGVLADQASLVGKRIDSLLAEREALQTEKGRNLLQIRRLETAILTAAEKLKPAMEDEVARLKARNESIGGRVQVIDAELEILVGDDGPMAKAYASMGQVAELVPTIGTQDGLMAHGNAEEAADVASAFARVTDAENRRAQVELASQRLHKLALMPADMGARGGLMTIGVMNNSAYRLYCWHPETGQQEFVEPRGGLQVLFVRTMPEHLLFYYAESYDIIHAKGSQACDMNGLRNELQTPVAFGEGWVNTKIILLP